MVFDPRGLLQSLIRCGPLHLKQQKLDDPIYYLFSFGPSLCANTPTILGSQILLLANTFIVSIRSLISIFSAPDNCCSAAAMLSGKTVTKANFTDYFSSLFMSPASLNECPGYDTKQSDGEVPAMLELWEMWSTPLLPLLPGALWPRVVAPDMGPIYGLNRIKLCFFHWSDFCI